MYSDYEESFYYNKPSSVSSGIVGEAVGLGLGLGVGLISTIMSGLLFLIARIDILSSSVLGLLFFLLTYRYEWSMPVYITGIIAIFAVSMMFNTLLKYFGLFMGCLPVLQYLCLFLPLLDVVQKQICIRVWQSVLV